MKAEVITITPELASNMLMMNKTNRSINKDRVLFYKKIIEKGDWMLNGESIKFSINGDLIDGQHRLNAIISAKRPIETLVISGLDHDAFKTIDTGKTRSAGDTFRVEGVKNGVQIAAGIIKYLILAMGNKSTHTGNVIAGISTAEVLDEYRSSEDYYQHLFHLSSKFYERNFRIITKAEYIGFYKFFNTKYSTDVVELFFSDIETNTGVCALLKNKLLSELVTKRKMTGSERTALMIKTFNYFISKKEVKQLKFSREEKFPTI